MFISLHHRPSRQLPGDGERPGHHDREDDRCIIGVRSGRSPAELGAESASGWARASVRKVRLEENEADPRSNHHIDAGCGRHGCRRPRPPRPPAVRRRHGRGAGTWASAIGVVLVLALVAWVSGGCGRKEADGSSVTLVVSAAADLRQALPEVARRFTLETGVEVVFNFGSSGLLAQQIEQGAPVDVIFSANESYVDELEEKRLVRSETRAVYGRGRLVLWTRPGSDVRVQDIQDLSLSEVRRVAIANPEHAPYGLAARQALETAGLLDVVAPKLVLGENVLQALQYVESGNAEVGIVALSLVVKGGDTWVFVPESLHQPINQTCAVIAGSAHVAEATRFVQFVNGTEGRTIMRSYGFVLPGESPLQ